MQALARRVPVRRWLSSSSPAFVIGAAEASPEACRRLLETHGFVVIEDLLSGSSLESMSESLKSRTAEKVAEVEGVPMGVGSAASYEEVVLRSPGRLDIPYDFEAFRPEVLAGLEAVVRGTLGSDCERAFCGTVLAKPGSPAQEWHADSLHEVAEERPANLLNVLVALDDVSLEMGPTDLLPGSHRLTNHLDPSTPFGTEIVYQRETHCPELVGLDSSRAYSAVAKRGSAIIFDDRLLHRGGANASETDRVVGYFSYLRKGFVADTHFEAYRSLRKLRDESKTLAGAVGPEFPGLEVYADAAVLDGASGSQAHAGAIEAVRTMMVRGSANVGGEYPASVSVLDAVTAGRRAAADLLGCDSEEIVFGHNATTLVIHAARALEATWAGGDNIVLSSLDHDTNAGPWVRAAERAGVDVRWIPLDPEDPGTLDLDALDRPGAPLVDARTRFVACGLASNGLGTINDVERVCAAAHRVGAVSFVDAVHYAPHGFVDVQSLGCDLLVVSPYKFFGPHAGVLFGKRELLEGLGPDKVRCSDDGLPSDANCHMSKWEPGTQNFEAIAGVTAAVDYLASLGDRFGGLVVAPSALSRRDRLRAGFAAIGAHEHALKRAFLAGAQAIDGLTVHGLTDHQRLHERTATFAVSKQGVHPQDLVAALVNDHAVYTTWGNHYCTFWNDLGLDNDLGACRLGFLHYNTVDDVQRALDALRAV